MVESWPDASPPVNTVAPSISGTTTVTSTLTGTPGTYSGTEPITLTHQWKRNGVAISGETGLTYVLTLADVGMTITWDEVATNSVGTASETSNELGPVTTAYEFWVNPSTGNNANAGTSGSPFQTVAHAAYNALAGLWPTTVTVNVVPGADLITNDRVRLFSVHLGGHILVRSSDPETPWTAGDDYSTLVEMGASVAATLRLENCDCTRDRVVYWTGTEAADRVLYITLADSTFTHAQVNA